MFLCSSDAKPTIQELQLLKQNERGSELRIIESMASKWQTIAIFLGFDGSRIETIDMEAMKKPEDACRQMLKKWLDGDKSLKPVTWKAYSNV